MRLIDRDEMLSPKIWDMNIPNDIPKEVHDSLFELYNRLIHIPTVDAEPIVRCKDCKRSQDNEHGCILKDFNRNAFEFNFSADGFCSFGERRND